MREPPASCGTDADRSDLASSDIVDASPASWHSVPPESPVGLHAPGKAQIPRPRKDRDGGSSRTTDRAKNARPVTKPGNLSSPPASNPMSSLSEIHDDA